MGEKYFFINKHPFFLFRIMKNVYFCTEKIYDL